jgi:PAS domain S-box-containing protein
MADHQVPQRLGDLRADAAIENSMRIEERFRRIERNLPCVIYEYVSDDTGIGHFVYFTPQWLELTEVSAEAAIADVNVALGLIHPEDIGTFIEKNTHAAQTMTVLRIEFRIVTASGKVKWTALTSSPMSRDDAGMITWNGVMIDVTAEKRVAEDLRIANERFARMAETLPVGLYEYVIHADGRSEYLYLSQRAQEIYEYTHAELQANMSLFWGMVDTDDLERLRTTDVNANLSGSLFISEFRITTRSGKRKWVRLTSLPESNPLSIPVVWHGVLADITAEKQAEQAQLQQQIDKELAEARRLRIQEVEQLNAELAQAIEEKNQLLRSLSLFAKSSTASNLVSTLAHEVNQPLGAIAINAQSLQSVLEDRANELDIQDAQYLLGRIRSDNQRAAEVISRLRSLFMRGSEQLETFDLNELITETADAVGFELSRQNVAVTLELDPSKPSIRGDRGQIQMIIFNALNNAIDALRSHEGARSISIRSLHVGESVMMDVQDSGPGFPDHILHAGFQLFQTTKPNGMGVGLWLSRAIADNHKGTIGAFNMPSGGARVVCSFPVCSLS